MYDVTDTIAALATARDGALRGIVRVSGPCAIRCLQQIFRSQGEDSLDLLRAARMLPGTVRTGEPIGEVPADVYLWPTQRSYTRQPCLEIHTIGAPPILDAVLAAVCQAGARLAEPGEFTLRAFLAGRLDLTQAEAVLGVIDARGESELDAALHQLAGGLARPLHEMRDRLLELLAHLEAGLDFVEEDLAFITPAELDAALEPIQDEVAAILRRMDQRTHILGEPSVVFVGSPNVGKSSLVNALAESPAAIVSDKAGTTRDYVSCRIVVDGRTLILIDTAGLDTALEDGGLCTASQDATERQAERATLQVLCLDSSRCLNPWEIEQFKQVSCVPRLVVLTKCDRALRCDYEGPGLATSSHTGQGLDELRRALLRMLDAARPGDTGVVAHTATRCRESLRRAAESLERARQLVHAAAGDELVAAELRLTLDELGAVVGAVYTEDLLDRIFSRFCIGK